MKQGDLSEFKDWSKFWIIVWGVLYLSGIALYAIFWILICISGKSIPLLKF